LDHDVVARTVGTMPGAYALMPMPTTIFEKYKDQIGLAKYPIQDKATCTPTDPYDPACATRWPPWVNQTYLQNNIATLTKITDSFDKSVASRFVNVRSKNNRRTVVRLRWENIFGSTYKAGSGKPVTAITGDGDGEIPWWSAFHMGTPAVTNRWDLKQDTNHVFLLEDQEVIDLVDCFVKNHALPKRIAPRRRTTLKIADRTATKKAVRAAIRAHGAGRKITGPLSKWEIRRGILQQIMS
jgi:hypothetical protein